MEKTMKKFRAAALNCDLHNKREKQLSHTRPELQPKDPKEWMWEAPDKKSVYQMRKLAEKEYHAVEVIAHGKHGDYVTHKSLPKNAEPVKEAVVRVKKDTTVEDVKRWANLMEQKYGIRAVGIYLHLDEGHWATLKEGQTEDMYRRTDGKQWKRLNEFGEWEYWKSNYHAHVDFDWFDHKKGRCISLGKKVMSSMEDDLARILGMERGTPKAISGVQGIDTWDYKDKMEKERMVEKYARGKEKIQKQENAIISLDSEISTKQQKLNDQDIELRRTEIKVKGLSRMLENMTVRRNDIQEEIRQLEEDVREGRSNRDDIRQQIQQLNKEMEDIDKKMKDKTEKLNAATAEKDSMTKELAKLKSEIETIKGVTNIKQQHVDAYVKALPDVTFTVSKDIRNRLASPLKDQPRVAYPNPPLTVTELMDIVAREVKDVVLNKNFMTSAKTINDRIDVIINDANTILANSVGENQKAGIIEANQQLYNGIRKELADVVDKATKYDELVKTSVSMSDYEKVKEKAERLKETEKMLYFAWPALEDAKNILTDPQLDDAFMTKEQEKKVLDCLRSKPEERIEDIKKILEYADNFREISLGTKAEAIMLTTRDVFENITQQGYQMDNETAAIAQSISRNLELEFSDTFKYAVSAAVCLAYGYLNGATTITASCGGGGGSNDLPKKHDNEDFLTFFGRCMKTALGMMAPKKRQLRI